MAGLPAGLAALRQSFSTATRGAPGDRKDAHPCKVLAPGREQVHPAGLPGPPRRGREPRPSGPTGHVSCRAPEGGSRDASAPLPGSGCGWLAGAGQPAEAGQRGTLRTCGRREGAALCALAGPRGHRAKPEALPAGSLNGSRTGADPAGLAEQLGECASLGVWRRQPGPCPSAGRIAPGDCTREGMGFLLGSLGMGQLLGEGRPGDPNPAGSPSGDPRAGCGAERTGKSGVLAESGL